MKIAIIGGGATGMMAAATILQKQIDDSGNSTHAHQILLFEKNNILGAKVRISGGGRCNLTTGITNTKELLTKYPRGAEFIEYALRKFTPKSIYKWFETNGLPLQMQDDMRAFPASNKGSDVVKVFEDIFAKNPEDIYIYTKSSVSNISKLDNDFFEIYANDDIYIADKVVIATGGSAYGHTGSTGDGYDLARKFGHNVGNIYPSLNSFLLNQKYIYDGLQGLSYNANINFTNSRGQKKTVYGAIVWTHFGISGPVSFALASEIADINFKSNNQTNQSDNPYSIYISYQNYDTNYRKLQIESYISQNPNKQIKTMLGSILPERLADIIIYISNTNGQSLDGAKPCGQISKNNKIYIYKLLSDGIPVSIAERRPGDEFVSAGGVNTDQINPKTMESLLCGGLYFGGELVDIDGHTGGFNLSACWASGRLIGLSI